MNKTTMAVQTDKLCVRLGENEALVDISCQIYEGEFIAVIGPNGAGKSLFLSVLLGLQRPSAGTVRVLERSPDKVPAAWVGYVPQIKTLDRSFPALAIELVATGLHCSWKWYLKAADKAAVHEALAKVGAAHLAERPIGALSGGELQRVYLARSLVRKPRLVLLDEPVTGVDTVGETDFYRVLEEFRQESGATILMVTHDWEVAAYYACHILVLNRRLISFGTPVEALCGDYLKRAYGVNIAPPLKCCPREQKP